MNIEDELKSILNDPLLDVTPKEQALFDMPEEMRKAAAKRRQADYVAKRKPCENFELYAPLFKKVHRELKQGKRNLIRVSKTANLMVGHYYFVSGQLLLLESVGELSRKGGNGLPDGRTRCIYENGTESDIYLQTLRKGVVADGYAVTETNDETEQRFFEAKDVADGDKVTGYIYVLQSLSEQPEIKNQKDLYKIGFCTTTVEERIANAVNESTYLMAPVKVVASYKVVNMHSQKLEDMVHQLLKEVQFHVSVTDEDGNVHLPKEWFVVPLNIVDIIIQRIVEGTILNFTYNSNLQCLEKRIVKQQSTFDTTGMKILTLNIKKVFFDEIIRGEKSIEYRELKQTTLNKYTYIDEADGKRYLRRYDALRLYVGYHRDRESALVQVTDITYSNNVVEYHLGMVLEYIVE